MRMIVPLPLGKTNKLNPIQRMSELSEVTLCLRYFFFRFYMIDRVIQFNECYFRFPTKQDPTIWVKRNVIEFKLLLSPAKYIYL